MKPNFDKTNYKNTDESGAVAFQVETDPMIMKRLSDDVYQRPVEAILRELGTNAYDAQVDNGTENQPFVVHLPTKIAPHFSLHDKGTGISKEDLLHKYTRYASSTRRESNNYVGSIGIGSKSPFAYTNQFQITSWHGGRKIVAICYKNELQVPHIQILSDDPSSEPTGLDVSFPVVEEDCEVFSGYASDVYQWFKVKPECNLRIDYRSSISNRMILEDEDEHKWGVFTSPYGSQNQSPLVVMGNVCYKTSMSSDIRNLVLFVDIGSVDIVISRESIQINDKNTRFLLDMMKNVKRGISKTINDRLRAEKKKYKRVMLLSEILTNLNGSFRPEIEKGLHKRSIFLGPDDSFRYVGADARSDYSRNMGPGDFKMDIIHKDCGTGFISGAESYMKQMSKIQVILLKGDIDRFCRETDYPKSQIKKASDYYVKKTGVARRPAIKSACFAFSPSQCGIDRSANSRWWKEKPDLSVQTKTGVLIPIDNWKLGGPDYLVNDNLKQVIDLSTHHVVGVRSKFYDKVKRENPHLISIDQAIANTYSSSKKIEQYKKHAFTKMFDQLRYSSHAISTYLSLPDEYQSRITSASDRNFILSYYDRNSLCSFYDGGKLRGFKLTASQMSTADRELFSKNAEDALDRLAEACSNSLALSILHSMSDNARAKYISDIFCLQDIKDEKLKIIDSTGREVIL